MEIKRVSNGIEHGLLGTLVNQVPKSRRFKNVDPKRKEELEKKLKNDSEMVDVRYINYKNQINGVLPKDYSAGAGEPIYLFKFLHNHTYKVPRGLVNEVNGKRMEFAKRADSVDENGQPRTKDGPPLRIHEFVAAFI